MYNSLAPLKGYFGYSIGQNSMNPPGCAASTPLLPLITRHHNETVKETRDASLIFTGGFLILETFQRGTMA
jgi:hypothetical protein